MTPGPDGAPEANRRPAGTLAAGGILFLLAACVAAGFVAGGEVTSDEGFYLEAARATASGRVLYRDFGFTQGPVVPLVTGTLLRLTGFGVVAQRGIDATLGLLGLGLLLFLAGAEGGPRAVRMTGIATALSFAWLHGLSAGNTFGLTALLLASSSWAFLRGRGLAGAPLAAALAALAVGCRLPAAPFLFVLVAAVLVNRGLRAAALAAAAALLVLGVVWGRYLLVSAANVVFWTVTYHASTAIRRPLPVFLLETLRLAPSLVLLVLAGVLAATRKCRSGTESEGPGVLLLAALVAAGLHGSVPAPYGGYLVPFAPVAAAAAAILTSRRFSERAGRLLEGALLAVALAGFVWVPQALGPESVSDLRMAAAVLKRLTPEDSQVVTTTPEVAVEAGRPVLAGLEMGKFGFTDTLSAEESARLRLLGTARLLEALERGEAGAVVLSSRANWNFAWSAPSLLPTRPETRTAIREALDRNFAVVHQGPAYTVFLRRSPAGSGR